MSLPIVSLPLVERWDCHQCGVCCRGSIVPLSDADVERLRRQKWEERPEFKGVRIMAPHAGRDKHQLAKRPDGSCVFLMEDGLCRIHKELGFDAKPLVCRMFPLQLVPQESRAVLTMRRACPSAAGDKGRELRSYAGDAKAYAREGKLIEEGSPAPAVRSGDAAGWSEARIVLESLRRLTTDERYPLIRRLVHGLEICRLLEEAQLGGMSPAKLSELLQVLEEHIAEEGALHFAERTAPSAAAQVLFRQIALELVRLHPRAYVRPTWSTRLKLAGWSWRMLRGRAKLPQVIGTFPEATFEALEEPLGRLDRAIYQPLERYYAAMTTSYLYALVHPGAWSVVESYRQLALQYPLALYLLRWCSAGRSATPEDIYEIITALDRSQGYDRFAGGHHRGRLRTLARLGALPGLVAWYGR